MGRKWKVKTAWKRHERVVSKNLRLSAKHRVSEDSAKNRHHYQCENFED